MKSLLLTLLIILFASSIIYAQNVTVVEMNKIERVDDNGVERMTMEGEVFNGKAVEYYEDGRLKLWMSVKDGLPDGRWQEWYTNGKLRFDSNWKEAKGHGLWHYYHENGVLRQEEFYSLDVAQGIFRDYYNNGQLKTISTWRDGKRIGEKKFYSDTGLLIKSEFYVDGELIETKEY